MQSGSCTAAGWHWSAAGVARVAVGCRFADFVAHIVEACPVAVEAEPEVAVGAEKVSAEAGEVGGGSGKVDEEAG